MNRTELAELIRNGENSGVEFKRDDVRPDQLAKEMAALLNLEGGYILLGIEDDGQVTGLSRDPGRAEEWVMEAARTHLRPAAIPFWETIPWEDSIVGVVSLPSDAPDKPYKCKRGTAWVTQVRVGTTSRDATDEEEARLYMSSGRIQYDRKPVPGATVSELDDRRLTNYFRDFRGQEFSEDPATKLQLLINTEILVEDRTGVVPTVGGMLIFGTRPNRFLPQAGISAAAYVGEQKDYDARARETLRGPLVSLFAAGSAAVNGSLGGGRTELLERGVIDQAIDFVLRNSAVISSVDETAQRNDRTDYPREAVREALVNAVAHRDYSISVTDVELALYSDRLEVVSPGRLPNTVTVEKMKAGYRASRNELVKEILRDYRYIEATGLGVPRKIIAGMIAHTGREPDLIEEDDRFTVRMWR